MSFDEVLKKLMYENTKTVSDEAFRLLFKIAENVLKDPSNPKLRCLQKNNAVILNKILLAKGAVECLQLMGFEDNKTSFTMHKESPLTSLQQFKDAVIKFRNIQDESTSNVKPEINNPTKSNGSKNNQMESPIKKVKLPPLVLIFSNPLLRRLEKYFHGVLQYENKDLQERARKLMPLVSLEQNAQKRLRMLQEHIKRSKLEDPNISLQDMLILELLKWFKEDFFSWVDSPECSYCSGKTIFSHMSTDPDMLVYTDRVELHRCTTCHQFTAFPRYNDLNILLETRRGRCGEWANVFTLFCRAMGWDSRFIVEEGDHVWTEVYSVTQKRWLHCDPCENICDRPLIYENGWHKKISYVMAYSAEEVQDVTWRYSSNHKEVLKRRNLCSENELLNALIKLTSTRQKNLSDTRRNYLTKRLLNELVEFLNEKKPNENDKHGRSSGSADWRLARGEIQEVVDDSLFVWKVNGDDIIDNKIVIRYSTSLDKYEYISGSTNILEVKEWNRGAYKNSSLFRKEEKDWKMVYLSRIKGHVSGEISWKIELTECCKCIDTVLLNFNYVTYEDGIVNVQLYSDEKSLVLSNENRYYQSENKVSYFYQIINCTSFLMISNKKERCTNLYNVKLVQLLEEFVLIEIKICITRETKVTTRDFSGSTSLNISASLSGGKGDVAWQHSQLFRQSSDSSDFPFSLTIIFK